MISMIRRLALWRGHPRLRASLHTQAKWGLCEYVIVHTILGGSPLILCISLGGMPKWLPLKLRYHGVMRTSPSSLIFRYPMIETVF